MRKCSRAGVCVCCGGVGEPSHYASHAGVNQNDNAKRAGQHRQITGYSGTPTSAHSLVAVSQCEDVYCFFKSVAREARQEAGGKL